MPNQPNFTQDIEQDAWTFQITREVNDLLNEGLVLTSPNGTRYRLVVADDGTLTTEEITRR